jgi:flagellar hook-length control protein FliK
MQTAAKAEVTVDLEAPPAPEPLPAALTQSSLADRLARALMTQHGVVGGEGTPGSPTDTVQLGAMLNSADDGPVDLTGWTAKSQPAETPAPVLRPVTLLATNPAGTRAGEAVTTRLPAGVDELSVMRQINDGMKLKLGKKQTAEIQLHPAELGRVNVKLQMESGVARVFLTAEHAGVADLLSSQLDQLRDELSAQGVQVEHFEVSYHGDDAGGGSDGGDGEGEEVAEERDAQPDPTVSRRRHDGRISVTA